MWKILRDHHRLFFLTNLLMFLFVLIIGIYQWLNGLTWEENWSLTFLLVVFFFSSGIRTIYHYKKRKKVSEWG